MALVVIFGKLGEGLLATGVLVPKLLFQGSVSLFVLKSVSALCATIALSTTLLTVFLYVCYATPWAYTLVFLNAYVVLTKWALNRATQYHFYHLKSFFSSSRAVLKPLMHGLK